MVFGKHLKSVSRHVVYGRQPPSLRVQRRERLDGFVSVDSMSLEPGTRGHRELHSRKNEKLIPYGFFYLHLVDFLGKSVNVGKYTIHGSYGHVSA